MIVVSSIALLAAIIISNIFTTKRVANEAAAKAHIMFGKGNQIISQILIKR